MAIAWGGRQTTLMLSDGYGRVVASQPTGPGTDGFTTVVADVPLGPGATPYTRFGDWFSWLCLALTAFALLVRKMPIGTGDGAASGVPSLVPPREGDRDGVRQQ